MILIFSGLPASGKTTAALEWVKEDPTKRRRVNYDDIRASLYGCKGERYFSLRQQEVRHREGMVKAEALKQAEEWLTTNPVEHSVVIDNCNLTEGARRIWVNLAKRLGVEVVQQDIDTPPAECVRRDAARTGDDQVGRYVIERMALFTGWYDWERDFPRKRVEKDIVICDIDGTLSDPTHRLHHIKGEKRDAVGERTETTKRWDLFHSEVGKDPCHTEIRDLVRTLSLAGYYIIVVSGRSPEHRCGRKTVDWLQRWGVPCDALYMRAAGDYRSDVIHKQEILDLLPRERIAFCIDDRDQVVKMWRQNGLRCLQVAEGNF